MVPDETFFRKSILLFILESFQITPQQLFSQALIPNEPLKNIYVQCYITPIHTPYDECQLNTSTALAIFNGFSQKL